MISTIAFDDAVHAFSTYLERTGQPGDARGRILSFLGWDQPDEDRFAQDVRVVLVSGDFSKEITTTVMWVAQRDLDIRCVRLTPYKVARHVLIDVEQVIPLPEAVEYQVRVSTKARRERQARDGSRDYSRFDVTVNGSTSVNLPKRRAILRVVQALVSAGIAPTAVTNALVPWQPVHRSFWWVNGTVDAAQFLAAAPQQASVIGRVWDATRYFTTGGDLMHADSRTYAFSNQWGQGTEDAMQALIKAFPGVGISVCQTAGED